VRLYDHLFANVDPSEDQEGIDSTASLNPRSLEVLKSCQVEPSLAGAAPCSRYQFERLGYFCVDTVDAATDALVFNRTVTLRDTLARIEKTQQKGQRKGAARG
jgi:glutaminyl-tRNA synthetase